MNYSEKKKASKKVLEAIHSLEDAGVLKVNYGLGFKGVPNEYTIRAYKGYNVMSYSIWSSSSCMSIDSLGPTTMVAYTFDMMSQKTTYTFPLYEMSLVEEDNNPLEKLPGFVGTEAGTL